MNRASEAIVVRIAPLDHRDPALARQVHAVLLPAHAQESLLLQAPGSAALEQTAQDLQASAARYLGAWCGDAVVGALGFEADEEPDQTLISMLVVHPQHQRQGIARALLTELLRTAEQPFLAVATGAKNLPALALYQSLGFKAYRFGTIGPHALPLVKLRRACPQGGARQ